MCERGTTTIVMIGEKPVDVDSCIAPIVATLNAAGIRTRASCCGHGIQPGNIMLDDGRELIIAPDFETARKVHRCFPPLVQWQEPAPSNGPDNYESML